MLRTWASNGLRGLSAARGRGPASRACAGRARGGAVSGVLLGDDVGAAGGGVGRGARTIWRMNRSGISSSDGRRGQSTWRRYTTNATCSSAVNASATANQRSISAVTRRRTESGSCGRGCGGGGRSSWNSTVVSPTVTLPRARSDSAIGAPARRRAARVDAGHGGAVGDARGHVAGEVQEAAPAALLEQAPASRGRRPRER